MLYHLLPLKLFVYLRLVIGILSVCISAHLAVLPLFNPVLNLTISVLPIMSSHPHASASDSTFDLWRCRNILLTLTLCTSHLDFFITSIGYEVQWRQSVVNIGVRAKVVNETPQASSGVGNEAGYPPPQPTTGPGEAYKAPPVG